MSKDNQIKPRMIYDRNSVQSYFAGNVFFSSASALVVDSKHWPYGETQSIQWINFIRKFSIVKENYKLWDYIDRTSRHKDVQNEYTYTCYRIKAKKNVKFNYSHIVLFENQDNIPRTFSLLDFGFNKNFKAIILAECPPKNIPKNVVNANIENIVIIKGGCMVLAIYNYNPDSI